MISLQVTSIKEKLKTNTYMPQSDMYTAKEKKKEKDKKKKKTVWTIVKRIFDEKPKPPEKYIYKNSKICPCC